MNEWSGRRVVVAGAGAGTGRALAVRLAGAGAHVVLGARTKERLDETAKIIRDAGGKAFPYPVDLTKAAQVESFFRDAAKDLGGAIDAVFCLTGGWHEGSLDQEPIERLEEKLDQYVKAALLVNRAAIPHLARGADPCLVNFSAAVGGAHAARGSTLYNTSKAAITGLTLSLAADLVGQGIRVNAILPGAISHKYAPGRDYAPMRKLGKAPGTPEDVAEAALFLASRKASWITGACLVVDGGWSVSRGTGF